MRNIHDQYPLLTEPPSAEFPGGGYRDVSFLGAGDGTPGNTFILQEAWGFLNALLVHGGLTPNGNQESAAPGQSQGLQSLINSFAPLLHAGNHIHGGSDEITGDNLKVNWVPQGYGRLLNPPGGVSFDDPDQLTPHLAGIDQNFLKNATGACGDNSVVLPDLVVASGNTLTLTEDLYVDALTVEGEIEANGYKIVCRALLGSGTISNNGFDAVGNTPGLGANWGTIGGGWYGTITEAPSAPDDFPAYYKYPGDTGGQGGSSPQPFGSGPPIDMDAEGLRAVRSDGFFPNLANAQTGSFIRRRSNFSGSSPHEAWIFCGGVGGGGGGGPVGGAGGGGGGGLLIGCLDFQFTGRLEVQGGGGGDGPDGQALTSNGGSGGGGGFIWLYYKTVNGNTYELPPSIAVFDASGGAGGEGGVGPVNGVDGLPGQNGIRILTKI